MDDIVKEFIVESFESLEQFDRAMVELEKNPSHKASLDSIFRTTHTIKGSCGFLGFGKLEKLAHTGESLLSRLRDGKLVLNPEMATALLEMGDIARHTLTAIEANGVEGQEEHQALIDKLSLLTDGPTPKLTVTQEPVAKLNVAAPPTAVPERIDVNALESESAPKPSAPRTASAPIGGVQSEQPTPPADCDTEAPAFADESPAKSTFNTARPGGGLSESTVRVDVSLLDKLMNLVGELVLARNQTLQHTGQTTNASLLAASQRLNLITTELQESVMKTRMQPIGNVWSKFPRIVRDVSHEVGKQVRLEMSGNGTELDRTIIEAIKDPLTHVVRNSIDHGIEFAEARLAAGKPAEGVLSMRAFHEGGQVNIEISDDGAGIDVERVKKKALEKGLLTPDQVARSSEREAMNLIFAPGFSTAEKITNVSGRGVGMDVVKTNIEKIGGSVDVHSVFGEGTTLRIKIPLTLAIIPALVVSSSGDRFAIPQVSLVELVRLEREQARKGIEKLYGSPVYRLRGQLLPLCYLSTELGLQSLTEEKLAAPRDEDSASAIVDDAVNICVLQADGRQFGLVVDEINDTEEIVVKPLSKQLKGITCFAGATIMGDGKVALILDVLGLAQHANVVSEVRDRSLTDKSRQDARSSGRQTLLLFDANGGNRMAIPLSMVARLEEFPKEVVERSGDLEVVQYRGQILPLIRVSKYVSSTVKPDHDKLHDPMQVVVYSEQGRSVGLVVDQINDIVEEAITVRRDAPAAGILGSAVIQDKVTDLLDVPAVIRAADPSFFTETRGVGLAA